MPLSPLPTHVLEASLLPALPSNHELLLDGASGMPTLLPMRAKLWGGLRIRRAAL